ncbi:MAG: DMT family transporter [Anaerolineales bacterium]|nr:DMT family transporter [Anaerolineales bacterium]
MKKNPEPLSERLVGILMVIAATLCWSTSGIFINLITRSSGISAEGLAFWRDLTTSLLLLLGILLINPGLLRVKRQDIPWLVGMGAISIGAFHIMWNKSVVILGASLATVVQCNAPVFVTVMAWFLFQEVITTRKIIAVVLAAAGTVLVSGVNFTGEWKIAPLGLIIALGSAITYGTLSLFGKKLSGDYNSWTIMFYIFSIGTVTLFLYQLGQPAPWPQGSGVIPWFIGFVLISTIIGFGLYTMALRKLPASVASITATTEILFASFMGYIFLQERMDAVQVIGALLIISGVILVTLAKEKKTTKETLHG